MAETAVAHRFTDGNAAVTRKSFRFSHLSGRSTQTDAKATDNIRVAAAPCRSEWGDKIFPSFMAASHARGSVFLAGLISTRASDTNGCFWITRP
jgi:alkylhydroperoxidase family enzyme